MNIFDIFQYQFRKVTPLFSAKQPHTSKILNKTDENKIGNYFFMLVM